MLLVLPVGPGPTEGVGEIVWSPGLIVGHSHGAVSLVVPETVPLIPPAVSNILAAHLGLALKGQLTGI